MIEISDENLREHFKGFVKFNFHSSVTGKEEKHFDEAGAIAALMADEKIIFIPYKDEILADKRYCGEVGGLVVLEHDVFAWGYTSYTPLKFDDLEDLYDHWAKDANWGIEVWLCKKRGMMPQKPMADRIRKAGVWDLDALGLEPSSYDAKMAEIAEKRRAAS